MSTSHSVLSRAMKKTKRTRTHLPVRHRYIGTNIRWSEEEHALILRAVLYSGSSISDIIRQGAIRWARSILADAPKVE